MKHFYVTITGYRRCSRLVSAYNSEAAEEKVLNDFQAEFPDFEWEIDSVENHEKERGE